MIPHLSGTLLAKHATSVIVDVGGVGYEVTIPVTTFTTSARRTRRPPANLHARPRGGAPALRLPHPARARAVHLLISVSGIGPKSAVAMLSGMNADEIVTAIRRTTTRASLRFRASAGRRPSGSSSSCATRWPRFQPRARRADRGRRPDGRAVRRRSARGHARRARPARLPQARRQEGHHGRHAGGRRTLGRDAPAPLTAAVVERMR